jgi:exosome complex exonuclease DIS3/RRP44
VPLPVIIPDAETLVRQLDFLMALVEGVGEGEVAGGEGETEEEARRRKRARLQVKPSGLAESDRVHLLVVDSVYREVARVAPQQFRRLRQWMAASHVRDRVGFFADVASAETGRVSTAPVSQDTPVRQLQAALVTAVRTIAAHVEETTASLRRAGAEARGALDAPLVVLSRATALPGGANPFAELEETVRLLTPLALMSAQAPHLADLLHGEGAEDGAARGDGTIFPAHWSAADVAAGVRAGKVVLGVLRLNRHNRHEGFVEASVAGLPPYPPGSPVAAAVAAARLAVHEGVDFDDTLADQSLRLLIPDNISLNRGCEGDRVAVEVEGEAEWRAPTAVLEAADGAEESAAVQLAGASGVGDEDEEGGEEDEAAAAAVTAAAAAAGTAVPRLARVAAQPTARVVRVDRRAWKPQVGTLLRAGGSAPTSAIFVPRDSRQPRVRIRTRQYRSLVGKRIVVVVDDWPATSLFPVGHYVRSLGESGDTAVETEALLMQYDVPHGPFPPAALAELGSTLWTLSDEPADSLVRRTDLRGIRVMSIDPVGCTDIDDALSVERLGVEEGTGRLRIRLGVHIADVSHFVRPGSALDTEAASRGTTVYLVDRRIDMLPTQLSSHACSLVERQARLAFSCRWEGTLSADGTDLQLGEGVFVKTIIESARAFSYGDAQAALDAHVAACGGDEAAAAAVDSEAGDVALLTRVARCLRARRVADGALFLASLQVRFTGVRFDEEATGAAREAPEMAVYEMHSTNSTVEEFMLLANVAAARRALTATPSAAVLRRHPVPSSSSFDPLRDALRHLNIELDVSSSSALAACLDAAEASAPDDPAVGTLVRMTATRCMTSAVYFAAGDASEAERRHYGLAVPHYTHFTSPIRRYADLLVHRQLATAIGVAPPDPNATTKAAVRLRTSHLNHRTTAAQRAARESIALHTTLFFRTSVTKSDAHVVRVRANALTAVLPQYGIEVTVHLDGADDAAVVARPDTSDRLVALPAGDEFVFDAATETLRRPRDGLVLRTFSKLRVAIFVTNSEPHRGPRLVAVGLDPLTSAAAVEVARIAGTGATVTEVPASPKASAKTKTKAKAKAKAKVVEKGGKRKRKPAAR